MTPSADHTESTHNVQSKTPTPDVSVIVVSWNVSSLLSDCLRALHSPEVRQDIKLEVIVVDNASTDDSVGVAKLFSTTVIENSANLGYGRANNIGLAQAAGKHILVLNPDTVPQPGSVRALLDFVDAKPKAGIASPRLLNPDGTTQSAAFTYPTLLMAALDLFPLPAFLPGRLRQWLANSSLNGRTVSISLIRIH